eukprot:1146227-Pelagomonas_calceolata.AAC.4
MACIVFSFLFRKGNAAGTKAYAQCCGAGPLLLGIGSALKSVLFRATNLALYQTQTLHAFYRNSKVPFIELLPPLCEMQPAKSTEGHCSGT